jgi:GNAT superfamily N-acetyltransferase
MDDTTQLSIIGNRFGGEGPAAAEQSDPEPTVELRPAGDRERAFFARVYASTREEELAQVPFSPEERAAFLAQQFASQSAHYADHYSEATTDVIVVDGDPAGRLMVMRWHDEILIVDIALLPAHRSRGIGTRVLEAIIEEAADAGSKLTIHVERMNPALRLYQRLGFEPVGDEGLYLTMQRPANENAPREDVDVNLLAADRVEGRSNG